MGLSESSAFVFGLRSVVWTGWLTDVGLLTLLVSFHTLCRAAKGSPEELAWAATP